MVKNYAISFIFREQLLGVAPPIAGTQLDKAMEVSGALLLATLSLWILQTAMPSLERHLPELPPVTRHSTQLRLPLGQLLLNQLLGLLGCLCSYCLLRSRSGARRGGASELPLGSTLWFLVASFLVTTGHGVHTVCAIVEGMLGAELTPPLHALVDLLHEVTSHNMFVSGFFVMLALVAREEIVGNKLAYGIVKKLDQNGDTSPAKPTPTNPPSLLESVLLRWVCPIILGMYFSIFATRTGTVPITLLFYAAVLCGHALLTLRGTLTGITARELLVYGVMVKSMCVGLPVLGLWLTGLL